MVYYEELKNRMEPDVNYNLSGSEFISIAISLKRIADFLGDTDKYGLTGSASLAQAIVDGLRR